jgi:hypothetical protein
MKQTPELSWLAEVCERRLFCNDVEYEDYCRLMDVTPTKTGKKRFEQAQDNLIEMLRKLF